jgi:hypothetical protein
MEVRMTGSPYLTLGQLAGAEVGVQPSLDGQAIIIQHSKVCQRLACLLAPGPGDAKVVRRDGILYWHIPHSQEVDRLLMELTELFTSIRYAHPTLVQLELQLDEAAP